MPNGTAQRPMGLATTNEILVQIMESVAGTHLNSTSQQYQMVNEFNCWSLDETIF